MIEYWLPISSVVFAVACWYVADILAERRYRHQIALRDTLILMLKQLVVREQHVQDPDDTGPPSPPLRLDAKSVRQRRSDKLKAEGAEAMKEYGGA